MHGGAGIPQKTMLNDRYPEGITTPPDVSLIETDFYKFNPSEKYDLVICNQVMEHVDDPAAFAQKLLSIGKVVIASVPYRYCHDVLYFPMCLCCQ